MIVLLFADDVLFSRRGRMGKIYSPRHTLPPNTTCTYHFHGYPGDLIWISFTSFNLQILQQAIHDNNTLGRVSYRNVYSVGACWFLTVGWWSCSRESKHRDRGDE